MTVSHLRFGENQVESPYLINKASFIACHNFTFLDTYDMLANLEEGGTFVAKVLAGGAEAELQKLLKAQFTKVAYVKPPASRSDSSEKFVVATGFKGLS